MDADSKPVEAATVSVQGKGKGSVTDKKGKYSLEVPANEEVEIVITHISFQAQTYKITLEEGEKRKLDFKMKPTDINIKEVEIQVEKDRDNTMESLDPKDIKQIPNPSGNFETAIKTLPGVSSNNELSSQYNVRGGSFDENLVYVNDIQIYRPFLVRSGNQEGLSFINPDLVEDIDFSAGGFAPRYGDKMSSVLAVTYKEPKEFGGSVNASLLGASVHVEGTGLDKRLTHISGVRYRTNQYILGSLETDGDYQQAASLCAG